MPSPKSPKKTPKKTHNPDSITIRVIKDQDTKTELADLMYDIEFFRILCRSQVSQGYLKFNIRREDSIVFCEFSNKNVVGIAVLHPDGPHTYEISTVCTEKNNISLGRILMESVKSYFCSKKCSFYLSPVSSAVEFYKKLGFEWEGSGLGNMVYTK